MSAGHLDEQHDIPAGRFSTWLDAALAAADGGVDAEVPCGSCSACCRSSYFVHIEPDERATLRRIPRELLFPAPGLPKGHVVLGYDERGHCPMLVDDRCSIYDDRPRTCRSYDCRVFTAAGLLPDDGSTALISQQVRRWRFETGGPLDRQQQEAVLKAVAFLRAHPECRAGAGGPGRPWRSRDLAVLALKAHPLFLPGRDEPDVEAVTAFLRP